MCVHETGHNFLFLRSFVASLALSDARRIGTWCTHQAPTSDAIQRRFAAKTEEVTLHVFNCFIREMESKWEKWRKRLSLDRNSRKTERNENMRWPKNRNIETDSKRRMIDRNMKHYDRKTTWMEEDRQPSTNYRSLRAQWDVSAVSWCFQNTHALTFQRNSFQLEIRTQQRCDRIVTKIA